MPKIKITFNPKSVSDEKSRIVHQGGESPCLGPTRQPK